MGKHRNLNSGVVVSVDDSKDDRYGDGWERVDEAKAKAPAKKAPAKSAAK